MNAIDYILDGLEAELALERELGVRTFEIDRKLLTSPAPTPTSPSPSPSPSPSTSTPTPSPSPSTSTSPSTSPSPSTSTPFAFLHDKPLSPAGVEMMAKIITALGKTAETAPVVIAPPVPDAKVYIVLGALALRKWFPGKNVAPGQWFVSEKGKDVLVSYSPEYILRFKTVTPAVKKIKLEMWNSIKAVLRKI